MENRIESQLKDFLSEKIDGDNADQIKELLRQFEV